jgi:hypothetical protein
MRLYVYYRISGEQAAAALAAFRQARGDLPIELLQRPESSEGLQTWMEVYPEGSEPLEPRIAAAMRAWLVGARHVERFEVIAA